MENESIWSIFRTAKWTQKARMVLLTALAGGVVAGTAVVVAVIVRLHLMQVVSADSGGKNETAVESNRESSGGAPVAHDLASAPGPNAAGNGGESATKFLYPYEIRNMTVPIANHGGNKAIYLQFTILFDCPSPEVRNHLDLNRAKLRNSLYEVALRFNEDDFRTTQGFARFKSAVMADLQDSLHADAPRDIAFRDWLLN